MSVAIAPVQSTTPDPTLQQLLMRFTGALNRRRAYAATHPMVVAAEQQLYESVALLHESRPVLTIGVMKTDLLIDGELYVTRSAYARELAMRLHRRGVGAITLQVGVPLQQLRELLGWLATEVASDSDAPDDRAPDLSAISVTPVAYDQLALGDVERAAAASGEQLWRSLAQIAGAASTERGTSDGDTGASHGGSVETDHDAALAILREAVSEPEIARRTAMAFMDLAAQGASAAPAGRARIGEQLSDALHGLGAEAFAPVIRALGAPSVRQRFVSQVVDVLPMTAVSNWLAVAAQAQDLPLSRDMLRLMSKLSQHAQSHASASAEGVFRGAAQQVVKGWAPEDPNPEDHVALLDRIALHEHSRPEASSRVATHFRAIESSRLVQMALEIDVDGDDAMAAAEALVAAGSGANMMEWIDQSGDTRTARRLVQIATSDAAIRQLLLTEPVDRLQARALLDRLDVTAADTLIDVLEAAEARGTRMIVRQRLAGFGADIMPLLTARLDCAPWYLVRNILTVLHEIAEANGDTAAGLTSMAALLDHAQVQVRTEAFRLLLLNTRARDAAIRRALRDDNERMVVLALQALTDSPDGDVELSAPLITELMAMVDAGKQNDTVRARMVRTLAQTRSDTVRDWLIGHVVKRSRILRRVTLNEPTQTAVAALQVLQKQYSKDPAVEPLIELARKHGYDRRWLPREPVGAPQQVA